jgi:flagellar biogenesis protein FliO
MEGTSAHRGTVSVVAAALAAAITSVATAQREDLSDVGPPRLDESPRALSPAAVGRPINIESTVGEDASEVDTSAAQTREAEPPFVDFIGARGDAVRESGSGRLDERSMGVADGESRPTIGVAASLTGGSADQPPVPLGRELTSIGPAGESSPATGGSPTPGWFDSILPGGLGDIGGTIVALAIVVGLILLLGAVARRFGGGVLARGGRPSGVIEVLARYPIARGQSLVLLKLHRRVLLVHQTGSAMTTLTDVHEPEEVASLLARVEASDRDRAGGGFARALAGAQRRFFDHGSTGGDVETIDLTRPRLSRVPPLLGRRPASA